MMAAAPRIIFGAIFASLWDADTIQESFTVLQKHDIVELDTAAIYPGNEDTLGKYNAAAKFTIHTKAPWTGRGGMTKEAILSGVDSSRKALGVDTIDLYYLHGPDAITPLEDTLSGIQEAYAAGKFKRLGISNFKAHDIQKIYDIQAAAKSVLPTVYQGNYNAVARHAEADLFPLLRKLKICFYAYSPIAGGFLVKDSAQLRAKDLEGRWTAGSQLGVVYYSLYCKESLYNALDEWGQIAKDAGISKAALSFRWIAWHSALKAEAGDGFVLGASSVSQLEESLAAIEAGPLNADIASRASSIWESIKDDAPLDNYHDFMSFHV